MNQTEAKIKIEKYCVYQERCTFEVVQKLKSWSLSESCVQELVQELVKDNFLNEERFIQVFVNSKIKLKRWGIRKIEQELYRKQIPLQKVKTIIDSFENSVFDDNMNIVAEKWLQNKKEIRNLKPKLFRYLQSKGYETDKIYQYINQIENDINRSN